MHNNAYSDFHPTLRINDDGNVTILYDEEVIKQSIRTILATVQGERVRSPFGSTVARLLFEPMDSETSQDLQEEIVDVIIQNEPRVDINRVTVVANEDNNSYDISIDMNISELASRLIYETKLRSFYND